MPSHALFLGGATVALVGCASNGAAPATPAVVPIVFGEKVTMNVAAGKYEHYIVEGLNEGNPIEVGVTLTLPRSTTKWAPSIRLCARGDRLSEHSCLWFIVDADQQTIYATPYSGSDPAEASRSVLPYRTRVGAPMAVTLKLQPSSFTLSVDGKTLLAKATDFELRGYSFGCVSATCSFDFPDLAALGEAKAPSLTVEVARTAGLASISQQPASGGDEIRIWIHTLRVPYQMIVLRETRHGVDGDIVYWWGQAASLWGGHPAGEAEYLRDVAERNARQRNAVLSSRKCAPHGVRKLLEACRVALREPPDWRGLLAQLDRAAIRELPDSAQMKTRLPPGQIADGVALEVELRRGAQVRSYRYSNPDNILGPEALNAKRILEISWKFLDSVK